MFVTGLIQETVAGSLRFDFIESTITAVNGHTLSSQKGCAQSEPAEGAFLYRFQPRGVLKDEWVGAGGHLAPEVQGNVHFSVSGSERSSATWSGNVIDLRLSRGTEGHLIHGRVNEWSRSDEHYVRMSFMRAIVPGSCCYPTKTRTAAGQVTRNATVSIGSLQLEFRDHGNYTEICGQNVGPLPDPFADDVVAVLGGMFDLTLGWVYRELHREKERFITVKPQAGVTRMADLESPSALAADYHAFWQSYAQELAARL